MPSPADFPARPTSPPGAETRSGKSPTATNGTPRTTAFARTAAPRRAPAALPPPTGQRFAARGTLRTLFFTAPCPFHFFFPRTLYAGGFDWGYPK